ncbi:Uncharacterized protein SCF082_LOCUS31385, partial [Durusdinium trenchii]
TMTSTSEFITNMASPDNPWVRLPGWDIQVLMSDWLHLVDLSLAPDACASALIELTESGSPVFPGANQDDRLRTAYVEFCRECRRHKISSILRYFEQHLGVTSLGKSGKKYPSLAQKHLNGAAGLRAAVFTNLVGMRDALSKSGLIISPESLQQLKSCCYLYHSALNGLALSALELGKLAWKIRPKGHKLDHLVFDQAARHNPLLLSTYGEEDFVPCWTWTLELVNLTSVTRFAMS